MSLFNKKIIIKKSYSGEIINKEEVIWDNGIYRQEDLKTYEVFCGKKRHCYFKVKNYSAYIEIYLHLLHISKINRIINEICKYLFSEYEEAYKITTYILKGNRYGSYILKKNDFEEEVCLREEYLVDGEKYDLVIMSRYNHPKISINKEKIINSSIDL